MTARISRRQLLVAGGVAGCSLRTLLLLRAFRQKGVVEGAPPTSHDEWRKLAPAALTEGELDTLMAAVNALLDVKETDHYAAAFQWRAMNVPGEYGVYRAFVQAVDDRARLLASSRFGSAERETRQHVIEQTVFLARGEQPALFYSQVVLLIFAKYASCDFWLDQGYDSWPGIPRGLVKYLSPAPGDDLGAPG